MCALPVFPSLPGLTFTSLKAPAFNTLVAPSPNGYEVRLPQTFNPLWTWTLLFDFLHDYFWGSFTTVSELRTLMGFFNGQYGKSASFLYTDPDDNSVGPGLVSAAPNVPLAQLQVVHNTANNHYYSPIQRTLDGIAFEDITDLNPINGSGLLVWANGTPTTSFTFLGPGLAIPGNSFMGMYLDWGTSLPATPVTASFNFYFRVRFDSDSQDFEKFLGTGGPSSALPPAGQGGGYWTIGGSEGQNGTGTLKLRTARPAPL